MSITKPRSGAKSRRDDNRYLELVRQFPLRPIRSQRDYHAAAKVMEELAVRGEDDLDADELDYLDVLTDLVETYDNEHYPQPSEGTAIDRLSALLQEADMSTADLGRLLGNSGLASQIMHGRRQLSKAHIRILSRHFKLDAGIFCKFPCRFDRPHRICTTGSVIRKIPVEFRAINARATKAIRSRSLPAAVGVVANPVP